MFVFDWSLYLLVSTARWWSFSIVLPSACSPPASFVCKMHLFPLGNRLNSLSFLCCLTSVMVLLSAIYMSVFMFNKHLLIWFDLLSPLPCAARPSADRFFRDRELMPILNFQLFEFSDPILLSSLLNYIQYSCLPRVVYWWSVVQWLIRHVEPSWLWLLDRLVIL